MFGAGVTTLFVSTMIVEKPGLSLMRWVVPFIIQRERDGRYEVLSTCEEEIEEEVA
jgi:hypothetical protein